MSELKDDLKSESIKSGFKDKYVKKPSPLEKAGFFSLALFTWLNPMIDVAFKLGEFDQDMHYDLRPQDKVEEVTK